MAFLLETGTPMKHLSPKRRRQQKKRLQAVWTVVARDGPECRAKHLDIGRCMGPVNGHEVISRARYPGGHLDPSNIILLCAFHNGYCEDNPARALELGLTKNSWDRERWPR